MTEGFREAAMVAANVGIFLGYVFVAAVVMPAMPVRLLVTKIGGALFFITCGLTHLELAIHSLREPPAASLVSWHMLVIHSVQVVAVWLFIAGLYQEFVKPHLTLKKARKR